MKSVKTLSHANATFRLRIFLTIYDQLFQILATPLSVPRKPTTIHTNSIPKNTMTGNIAPGWPDTMQAARETSGLSGKFGNKEAQPKHLDQGEKALE